MRASATFLAVLLVSCGRGGVGDPAADWIRVLHWKKAAVAPNATLHQKQIYADSVAAFVDTHPTHGRAHEVYREIQLDFARELSSLGRYHEAIRFYRAVLSHDASDRDATRGLTEAIDHLAVSRDKLLALQKGMSQRDVIHLLGTPIPGWTVRAQRRDSVIESWYYRNRDGGLAGVYFRDGELLAAEENSAARQVPLSRTFE